MTKEQLQQLGDTAAKQFISSGTNMNDTIAKMAEQFNLNQHQMQRVAEAANNTARAAMYRNNELDQAAVVFPLADTTKIASMITKQASMHPDYMVPPSTHKMLSKPMDNTIDQAPLNKMAAINAYHRAEATYSEAYDRHEMKKLAHQQAYEKMAFTLNQYLREHHDTLGVMKVAMKVAPQEFAEVFPILKEAAPADLRKDYFDMESLMNPNIKATYVIDDHPLVVSLKGYVTASQSMQDSLRWRDNEDQQRKALHGYIEQEKFASPFVEMPKRAQEAAPAKPGFNFGALGTAVNIGLPAFEAYSGYKADTGMMDQYRQMAKNPDMAGAHVQQLMQKHPEVFSKIQQRLGMDWDNTPEDRMLKARNKPRLNDDWANFPEATQAMHDRENMARQSINWENEQQ